MELIPLLERKFYTNSDLASPEVRDVRTVLDSLGEEPYKKYAEMVRKKQETMRGKASVLNMFKKSDKK